METNKQSPKESLFGNIPVYNQSKWQGNRKREDRNCKIELKFDFFQIIFVKITFKALN